MIGRGCGYKVGKRKSGHGQLSGRALRRYNERQDAAEQREAKVRAWMQLTPEERRKFADDSAYMQKIERNGITAEDVMKAEMDAYKEGVLAGKNETFRSIFAAVCLVLNEMHGFNDEQCTEVLNGVYDKAVYALTSKELIMEAYEKVGIELTFDGEAFDGPVSVKGE